MPKKGDYRYVDRNGNPITKAVYDKYAKNDGGYIQYFDGKNRGSTKISGGKYTAPESINTSDLSYSVDDVNAIREKYGDMAVDEYSNILDVDPNKTGTLIGKDKEYISNSTLGPRVSQQASTGELANVFPGANISFGNSFQGNNNTGTNLTGGNNTTIDFTGNNNINTTSTGTPNPKTNDTVITQQVPNTKPNKNSTSNNVPKNNSNSNNRLMTNRRKRAVAPDGSIQGGQTQEEFNQRLANYQMENDALRNQAEQQKSANREQIYSEAVAKYAANPNSFTPEQKDLLVRVGEQLGISPEQTAANILRGNNPTTKTVPTNTNAQPQPQPQPTAAPRVAPTVAPNNNDVSNYGGRYGAGDGNDYTNRVQGANNAARFWL